MEKVLVRNPFNYDSDKHSDDVARALMKTATNQTEKPEPEHRTKQEFLEESDVNYVAERFMRTGELPQVLNMPTGGDFSGIFDFQSAMNLIVDAKQQFMSLPAKVRSRFNNNPAELIQFIEDPANRKEAEVLGLIQPKETNDAPGNTESTPRTEETRSGAPRAPAAPREKPGAKGAGPKAGQDDPGGDRGTGS